jgi:hypothetical protein
LEGFMKRVVFVLVIALVVTVSAFAQSGSQVSFTVQSVSGRVQREAGNSRVDIAVGDVLAANTVVFTGIGANMVLRDGERTFTIPAGQNGRMVSDLIAAGAGVVITRNVEVVDTGAAARVTGQVSTASARASDFAGDDEICAE